MARTPVTTEVEQVVPGTINVAEALKQSGVVAQSEDNLRQALAVVEQHKPIFVINPIIDGFRECARPDCGSSFQPKSTRITDTDATEYYCSSDCAIHEFYRKRNLGPVPEKIVSGASIASNRAHREEKKRERAAAAPGLDAKYGPMRKVVEVLSSTKTAKKVKLECGHITASRGEQQRCRKCRAGRPIEAEPKEKPVKRQPVTRATVKKRTPVKPPKRGKKGK